MSNDDSGDGAAPSKRLFLKGVPRSMEGIKSKLEEHLAAFGPLDEIFLPDNSDKPYAIATFRNLEDAQRAVQETCPQLYSLIKFVGPKKSSAAQPSDRDSSSRRRKRATVEWDDCLNLACNSNLIIQVHNSHANRLSDYLKEIIQEGSSLDAPCANFSVLGMAGCPTVRSISLLFCNVESSIRDFISWLDSHPFASRSVNATYAVRPIKKNERDTTADFPCMERLSNVARGIYREIQKNKYETTIRTSVFPPRYQRKFLKFLEREVENSDGNKLLLSPSDYTHKVSVVQICDAQWNLSDQEKKDDMCGLFMVGILESKPTNGTAASYPKDDDICRAYHKLHEVFFRYPHAKSDFKNSVAVDAGAAPGGWTQYLASKLGCRKVYSIDPAKLAPSVLALPVVTHLPKTIERALPEIEERIDIWVSDMCSKDVQEQVDWLLAARKRGIAKPNTMFILTIKCSLGKSKKTFDSQAQTQAQRLTKDDLARDVQVIHLFWNRSSERTIVGYLR